MVTMGSSSANAIVSGRRERELIAVIDDDPLVLEAMAGLLRKWGYVVLTAATDRAALDALDERGRPPDLIVCDYHLSNGLTGIEAIERLRGAFRIPAFLITGDAAVAELAQAGALGIRAVRKPADPNILRAMLRQALGDSLTLNAAER
jgi:CheY-like chemotaxis protein